MSHPQSVAECSNVRLLGLLLAGLWACLPLLEDQRGPTASFMPCPPWPAGRVEGCVAGSRGSTRDTRGGDPFCGGQLATPIPLAGECEATWLEGRPLPPVPAPYLWELAPAVMQTAVPPSSAQMPKSCTPSPSPSLLKCCCMHEA